VWTYPPIVTPELVTAPTVEPVTLPQMELWLRQNEEIGALEETLLESLVIAAREWWEATCDRAFAAASWRVKLPYFSTIMELPYPPLGTVTTVKYLDTNNVEQTLSSSVYRVITSRTPGYVTLKDGQSWPATFTDPEAVRIVFTNVPGTVPEMVKNGIKLLAAFWYEHRGEMARGEIGPPLPISPAVQALAVTCMSHRF
jgi:uncharacterized phiE125 gp8 family phage protein